MISPFLSLPKVMPGHMSMMLSGALSGIRNIRHDYNVADGGGAPGNAGLKDSSFIGRPLDIHYTMTLNMLQLSYQISSKHVHFILIFKIIF